MKTIKSIAISFASRNNLPAYFINLWVVTESIKLVFFSSILYLITFW